MSFGEKDTLGQRGGHGDREKAGTGAEEKVLWGGEEFSWEIGARGAQWGRSGENVQEGAGGSEPEGCPGRWGKSGSQCRKCCLMVAQKATTTNQRIYSMSFLQIMILALVQGAAELLPVSSSAHVIVAEKLMGLNPVSPEMTLLLVMLHTGTMFAVLIYFWQSWKNYFFQSGRSFKEFVVYIVVATGLTGAIGLTLKFIIEKVFLSNIPHAEIELIFGNMSLISASLLAVGLLIIYAGLKKQRKGDFDNLDLSKSSLIGAVQGICLPFRGFSRSGATISAGLIMGVNKERLEAFSFALAVVLTPPVIIREVLRLLKASGSQVATAVTPAGLAHLFLPGLLGMVLSFLAGLLALKWLSSWLEKGRWQVFGYYCICASIVIFLLQRSGYL